MDVPAPVRAFANPRESYVVFDVSLRQIPYPGSKGPTCVFAADDSIEREGHPPRPRRQVPNQISCRTPKIGSGDRWVIPWDFHDDVVLGMRYESFTAGPNAS